MFDPCAQCEQCQDVYLQPGGVHFGHACTRIRTLLGSCVAVTFWHPQQRLGGMCHIMMPSRRQRPQGVALDGRYADEALAMLYQEMRARGTLPQQYVVKLFGGSTMFPGKMSHPISVENLRSVHEELQKNGMKIAVEEVGGESSRQIIFDVWSGAVWSRQNANTLTTSAGSVSAKAEKIKSPMCPLPVLRQELDHERN